MNAQPRIVLSHRDAERLERLLSALPERAFPGKAALEAELARADVVDSEDMPPSVVTMNSTVKFRMSSSDEVLSLTLVYPKDADGSGGQISVLSPVGSALLGLSQGAEIQWPRPGGGMMNVTIEDIVYQPERAGEHHR